MQLGYSLSEAATGGKEEEGSRVVGDKGCVSLLLVSAFSPGKQMTQ